MANKIIGWLLISQIIPVLIGFVGYGLGDFFDGYKFGLCVDGLALLISLMIVLAGKLINGK